MSPQKLEYYSMDYLGKDSWEKKHFLKQLSDAEWYQDFNDDSLHGSILEIVWTWYVYWLNLITHRTKLNSIFTSWSCVGI